MESGDVSPKSLRANDSISRYYQYKKFYDRSTVVLQDDKDFDDYESREAIWERLHRERMLREAAKYVDAFPELEWLYLRKLRMSVMPPRVLGGAHVAVPLSA